MSDSCDFTAPIKHEKEIDRSLAVYTDSHRAVARYTLILKDHCGAKAPFKIVQVGMEYNAANTECDRLNKAMGRGMDGAFAHPVHAIELENPEEAQRAVRIAADRYWAERRSEKLPLAA